MAFLAVAFLAVVLAAVDFAAVDFFAVVFFAVVDPVDAVAFFAVALDAVALAVLFLAVLFLAVLFLAVAFFAVLFLAGAFLAVLFFAAAFFAVRFLAGAFSAGAGVDDVSLSSSLPLTRSSSEMRLSRASRALLRTRSTFFSARSTSWPTRFWTAFRLVSTWLSRLSTRCSLAFAATSPRATRAFTASSALRRGTSVRPDAMSRYFLQADSTVRSRNSIVWRSMVHAA